MSVHAVAWQERLMAGWTLNPGPVPLGSGIGITVFLLIFCAKCHTSSVHWRRYCVRSDPTWSRTAEHMESVHGYLWEKRVPVEATFRGVWGQGDWGTVALCLVSAACPCQELGVCVSSWPCLWLPECPGERTWWSHPIWDVCPGRTEPLSMAEWGRMDVCGNSLCCRWRSRLCIVGLLWPAVQCQRSFPVTNFLVCNAASQENFLSPAKQGMMQKNSADTLWYI